MGARGKRTDMHVRNILKNYDNLDEDTREELYNYVTDHDTYSFTNIVYWINNISDHVMDVINFDFTRKSNNAIHNRYELLIQCDDQYAIAIKQRIYQEFVDGGNLNKDINDFVKRVSASVRSSLQRHDNLKNYVNTYTYTRKPSQRELDFMNKYKNGYTIDDFYEGLPVEYQLGVMV